MSQDHESQLYLPSGASAQPIDVPISEVRQLEAAYGGKRCILTGEEGVATQWCHIVPQNDVGRRIIDRLRALRLVPEGTSIESHYNLLPIDATRHILFDHDAWTVYPTRYILIQCIAIEERGLLSREAAIAGGQGDPGRPAYEAAYGDLQIPMEYNVYFGDTFKARTLWNITRETAYLTYEGNNTRNLPRVPPVQLITHVNIVVRQRTGPLIAMIPKTLETLVLAQLGIYLMALWDATPTMFRQMAALRPSELPPLSDSPQSPPETPTLASMPITNFTSTLLSPSPPPDGLQRGGKVVIASPTFPLTPPRSPEIGSLPAPSATCDADDDYLSSLLVTRIPPGGVPGRVPASTSYSPEEHGSCGRFTSNEWALVTTGSLLGGPLWNYHVE
ncbi:hypothetical protein FRB99_005484 [Tulasnella sp. 403]|nr:hypothetical protein FRB99_005484 [Tulasnella sp. 403]